MGKIQQNDHGSVVFNYRPPTTEDGDGYLKLWSSCRRKIIDTMRCSGGVSRHGKTAKSPMKENPRVKETKTSIPECGSEKLSELVTMSESSSEEEGVKKKVEVAELKRVVKRLRSGGDDDVLEGAREVRGLAKDDSEARKTLAMLGAIPPLVAMLDSDDLDYQIPALYALLNLGIGNDINLIGVQILFSVHGFDQIWMETSKLKSVYVDFWNKAAIVNAGALHKMLDLLEFSSEGLPNPDLSAAIVANLLGLSALDSNKRIIGSSGAISFLIKTLKNLIKNNSGSQVIQDSLRALYNLSILSSNVLPMINEDHEFISFLLSLVGDMNTSIRILSILSNVVSTPEGRKAVSTVHDVFPIMMDVLNWMDLPNCQEQATYILMLMAHKSYADRQAMIEVGIVSSLLELTLVGSTLAQKRSSRILEILRVDKGKQISENYGGASVRATLSAPLCGSTTDTELMDPTKDLLSSNAVKHLVHQSLENNMRRIVKRANLPLDFVASGHMKSLASFSTSKSLPF